jgi:pimeloyl-ACP methyl ester carboxylesterase
MQNQKYASDRKSKALPKLLIVAALVPFLPACSIIQLQRQVVRLDQHGAIGVVITPRPADQFPTYAFAWTRGKSDELESAGFQKLRDIGIASFDLLMNHEYGIAVFTDENANGQYEPGEPAAFQENVRPAQFTDVGTPTRVLNLALTRTQCQPPAAMIDRPVENKSLGGALRVSLGEVISLDDVRFSSECGSGGMWRPSDFLHENALGIYFSEPYYPNRMPVLFVHGIGGTPRDFAYMMQHFDRTRYQLWFFHYPSGMRLSRLESAMAKGLEVLHQRYGFKECGIVAHSMGGLVSAKAIRDVSLLPGTNFVSRFITISSPFGGHQTAQLGVRYLKKPVPSWIDVAPASEFLKNLARSPMPRNTHYDLIYGETGKDDGVVSVSSQLEPHNRRKADSVTRFPFGHEQILREPIVVNRVLKCLDGGKIDALPSVFAARDQ